MNISESVGESSSKRQENGDATNGSERPLKKARFAWQVKGKYHLKNETNESPKSSMPINDSEIAGSSTSINENTNGLVGNTEQNLEILGDYLLKQDFNTLDSVIADSDKSLLTPSTRISTETLSYPRYVSSYDNNRSNASSTSNNNNEHMLVPMSMVVSNNYNEDQCIARWQAKQMAKGFVDNTINRVLDSWMHPPMPPDMDNSRFLALDVAEFINNLPSDNSIENEGILMAISAHGLQNTSSCSSNICQSEEEQDFRPSQIKNELFMSPPSSPIQSEDEILNRESNNNKRDDETPSSDLSWTCMEDNMKKDDVTPFSIFPDSSNSYQYYETGHLHSEYDGDENSLINHFDFMDAAVSFAIQNKGLTTFGTDYG